MGTAKMRRCAGRLFAAGLAACIAAPPAAAQSNFDAWLSSTGTDAGDCLETAPCRSLNYALTQTAANGFVRCKDSGFFGFSRARIARSVTIDCSNVNALFDRGIEISDAATGAPGTAEVVVRGATFPGFNSAPNGIVFLSGFSLTVEDVVMTGFGGNQVPNGDANGIQFTPARAARLHVANALITNNGVSAVQGAGSIVRPTGPGYASITLDNVRLVGNRFGLVIDVRGANGSSTNATVSRSVISGGGNGVYLDAPAGGPGAGVTLVDTTISGSGNAGLFAGGALAQIRVSRSTISGNSLGVSTSSGGVIATYGNNTLIGNGVNGTFNGFPTEN